MTENNISVSEVIVGILFSLRDFSEHTIYASAKICTFLELVVLSLSDLRDKNIRESI